jgi:transcriptional regulator with XRE-family HTH domain
VGQAIRGLPETPALNAPSARPEPLGRWLARERRLRGLSLDEVAAATRIPRRSLERLEAGAFDSQPDGFTRGFVRTVADAMGLDATEAMARLLGEVAPSRGGRGGDAALWIAGAVLVTVLAAAGAGIGVWWRSTADAPAPVPVARSEDEVRRRDFVRELAAHPEEVAALRATLTPDVAAGPLEFGPPRLQIPLLEPAPSEPLVVWPPPEVGAP